MTLGKGAFEAVTGMRLPMRDIAGAWFRSERHGCRVYPMEDVTLPVRKPEYVERFRVDLIEVARMLRSIDGVEVAAVERRYEVVDTADKLRALVARLEAGRRTVLSVDCEWHGINHVDGKLRSLQIAWAPGEAAYVRFMDDALNYALDVDYREAGRILSSWLDRPEVRYVGHHISADLPWMHAWLGLEWRGKTLLDTEYAQQCCDEYEPRGLERLSVRLTDLGRYDMPLYMWCRDNRALVEDGYGRIPDDILVPYACADVDVVIRAYPHLMRDLVGQDLIGYYANVFNPMVADLFTLFALNGLKTLA